jgi:phage host-nuclease inhibitor protein Gam
MSDRLKLDADLVRQQIERLRTACPDVWGETEPDDGFLLDVLEGETDLLEWLARADAIVLEAETAAAAVGAMIVAYIEKMRAREARFDTRAKQVREMMQSVMEAAGLDKAKLVTGTLSVKDKPPSVVITDEAALPLDFVRITRAPDKTAIAKALKAGETVDGAELQPGGRTLAIRR